MTIHPLKPALAMFAGTVAAMVLTMGSALGGHADLENLSLGDLSNMGLSNAPTQVTASTAAKISQTTAKSPSVVKIVTAEDIKIFGYRSLADILGSLPGLYTTYDGTYTYLGVRGLGRPGDYNTRILILIDGIRINDNIYDSALVGSEFPLDTDLIQRVEYAPGPGSAAYGNNAFFGVVNVITKHGHNYDGFKASAGTGSFNTRNMQLSYGKRMAGGAEFLFSLTDNQKSDMADPLIPELDAYDSDFNQNRTFLGKFSLGGLTAQVVYGSRKSGTHVLPEAQLTNAYDTIFDKKLAVHTHYTTAVGNLWSVELSGTYHRALLKGEFPLIYEGRKYVDGEKDFGSWLTGELRAVNTGFQNHRLLIGLEGHRDIKRETQAYVEGEPPFFIWRIK